MDYVHEIDLRASSASGTSKPFPDYSSYEDFNEGDSGTFSADGWVKIQTKKMDNHVIVTIEGQTFQCGENEYTRANCIIIPVSKGNSYYIDRIYDQYHFTNCHVRFFKCK